MEVILVNPRGFCAGVDRAIRIVDQTLEKYGAPIYVRHEIVHNKHVVEDFKKRGVIFVDDPSEAPEGSILIFSAHGVSKAVEKASSKKEQRVLDATCPLVSKVHKEAQMFGRSDTHILMVGHRGHIEVEGTRGQIGLDRSTIVETVDEARTVQPPQADNLAILTQTTLSVDETKEIIDVLKERFPDIQIPKKGDICYATTNRQNAVRELAKVCDVVLVVGSKNSSNSNRLREVAVQAGSKKAFLIDDKTDLTPEMYEDAKTIGITAGASAPDHLVQGVVEALSADSVRTLDVIEEKMYFKEPRIEPRKIVIEMDES